MVHSAVQKESTNRWLMQLMMSGGAARAEIPAHINPSTPNHAQQTSGLDHLGTAWHSKSRSKLDHFHLEMATHSFRSLRNAFGQSIILFTRNGRWWLFAVAQLFFHLLCVLMGNQYLCQVPYSWCVKHWIGNPLQLSAIICLRRQRTAMHDANANKVNWWPNPGRRTFHRNHHALTLLDVFINLCKSQFD